MRQVFPPENFSAWREIARELLHEQVHPSEVLWGDGEMLMLGLDFEKSNLAKSQVSAYRVPKTFFEFAENVSYHRAEEKWSLLYEILWKLIFEEPRILQIGLDPSVLRCQQMRKAVNRNCHKMKAFVRFRETLPAGESEPHHIAWFEPEHLIVRPMSSFFKKRFTNMRWSILTPDECVHWDRQRLRFSAGIKNYEHCSDDGFENLWLTYYQNIFNPARLKEKAMCAEMPKKYWKNLPEAHLIPTLTEKGKQQDVSRSWDRQKLCERKNS